MSEENPTVLFDAGASAKFRGPTPEDADFEISYFEQQTLISSASSSNSTILDRDITTYTGATYDRGYHVDALEIVPETFSPTDEWESLDPSIATITSDGEVTRVTDGTARVLRHTRLVTKSVQLPVLRISSEFDQFTGYTTGTLAKHITDAITTRIVSKDVSHCPLFSTKNHDTFTYTRNTSRWLSGVDLTCLPVWKTYWLGKLPGVLITPRHVLFCQHQAWYSGDVKFVTSGNAVVTRTVIDQAAVPGLDYRIGKLDSDVPGTIIPVKTLPINWFTFLPSWTSYYNLPALWVDQLANAHIVESIAHVSSSGYPASISNSTPVDTGLLPFYKYPVSGDSGSPVFVIVNNQLVLLHVNPHAGPNSGDSNVQDAINAILTSLGGGHQLTELSLTGFPDY